MHQIQNEHLFVRVNPLGAELTEVLNLKNQLSYLWDADPDFWSRHAPVLFPVVGTLKDDFYFFEGKRYTLPRHGFARDFNFSLVCKRENSVTLQLQSDEKTLKSYPFDFCLRIQYLLEEDHLFNIYEVKNTGCRPMFFSIGGHPAFRVPLEDGLQYADYFLEFEKNESASRYYLEDGLTLREPEPFLKEEKIIQLHKGLFKDDALVFKNLKSGFVSLKTEKSPHGLSVRIGDFPFLGIWAAPGAPFICIEPWQGITDNTEHNHKLTEKEGIIKLPAGNSWGKSWSVHFF